MTSRRRFKILYAFILSIHATCYLVCVCVHVLFCEKTNLEGISGKKIMNRLCLYYSLSDQMEVSEHRSFQMS